MRPGQQNKKFAVIVPASYYAVTTRLFSLYFFECIYSIILFEIKHVYACHVLFFVVLWYRPILLLHIVIESRGLRVSQPIVFVLAFLSTVHVVASLPRVLHAGS